MGRITVLFLSACLAATAQDFRATVTGQILDSSGAAVAGAKIRATQKSTNQVTTAASNSEGFYSLPYLQPSTYSVEVEAPGFRKMRRESVTLMVAEKLALPFQLQVGDLSQEVTVTADATELIQNGDASGGMNFDSRMTSEFALNGRQVYMLMDLAPGVLFTQEEFGSTGFSGTRGWDTNGNFTMGGGKSGSNSFSLNGAPISLTGSFQLAPNVDAIQEFKVMTNTYDASLGRTGGGSVNTQLKSGTNKLNGTLFNFMRNQILDANHTQNNMIGAPRGKHITNQFGGTVGGAPVSALLASKLATTRLRAGYGQTEASPGIALGKPGQWTRGHLGTPVACETKLTLEGTLAFRGKNACLGYFSGEDGLILESPNRWVDTHDYVELAPGGMIFQGRFDDNFKLANGRLVDAALLESKLCRALPGVDEAAVFTDDGERLYVALASHTHPVPSHTEVAACLGPLAAYLAGVFPVSDQNQYRTAKGALDRKQLAHVPLQAA